jgi:hypothetical protein
MAVLQKVLSTCSLHYCSDGPCTIYHIPPENVPLKSEIFTKNVKEWPIEILNVNRKCPIIKILILITVIDCTNATNMWIKLFEAQWKVFFNYMFCRPYNKMA